MSYKKRNLPTALSGIFLIASAAVTGVGCTDPGEAAQATPSQDESGQAVRTVQVETMVLENRRFEDKIALVGVVESPSDAVLSAQSSGTLVYQSELGATIRRGNTVARIDATLIQAALDQARANLETAQARADLAEDTFKRQEPLYADSIISPLEYEQLRAELNATRAQLNQAKALVTQAEKQLENTYVRAPFSGRVEAIFAEKGEQLMPGAQVARIVDTDRLRLKAGVPERYAIDIRENTPVEVYFKAYGVGERVGTISFVGSVIDPQSRSFTIEVELDNREGLLKPEMVADLYVTRTVMDDQIVIPQTAVLRDETGSSVYVVDRSDGRALAARRNVELGASFGGKTVVTSGLAVGDEVIVIGQSNVTQGDAVHAVGETI